MLFSDRTAILLFLSASAMNISHSSAFTSTLSSTLPTLTTNKAILTQLHARNRRPRYEDDYDDDDEDGYYYEEIDEDEYERRRRRPPPPPSQQQQRRRPPPPRRTNLDDSEELSSPFFSFLNPFSPSQPSSQTNTKNNQPVGMKLPASVSQSLLAGTFVLGIGTGVTVDSQINTNPKDLASRDAIDNAAPNPTLCTTYGAPAMAFDQRVFVSFNPFNVYVAQADVKPACVLRPANVVPVLEDRGLINKKEVKQCKDNMSNTWAFVGDLNDYPQLSCVYRSEDAQNEFLSNPKYGIGEDIYDDDRAMLDAAVKGAKPKMIKSGLTEGQKEVKAKADALKNKNDLLLMEKESISS